MKNVLVESTKSKFQVLKNKPANVLKRIKGVLSDFGSNRNGRIYPRELWENVLNSDYVKEMINSHGLVGELDHPEERLEISLQEVSHVINDMWIEGDQVVGVIDILPTPNGKIVNELLDYGTDIGISSRGAGSVGSGNIVDPDYQFITFDFVARPSCEAARLNTILEGVKVDLQNNSDDKVKSILEGYKEELNESKKVVRYNIYFNNEVGPNYVIADLYDSVEDLGEAKALAQDLANNADAETRADDFLDNGNTYIRREYEDGTEDEKAYLTFKPKGKVNESKEVSYKDRFIEYCKDKIDDLGEVYTEYYDRADNAKVIFTQKIRDYGMCKVLDPVDCMEIFDVDDTNLSFVAEDGTFTCTPMISADILVARLEFDKIDKKFYKNVLKFWDEMSMEYTMDDQLGELSEAVRSINKKLTESMSDQEVYKVVLNWYKDQIEKGNMTLNQCYELLSDKAKVSLNKLVDQSKIKESIMNAEISKLLTEAEEINKDQEVGLWVNGKVYWEGNRSEVTDDLLMDVADQASEEDGTTYDYDEVDIKPLDESYSLGDDKESFDVFNENGKKLKEICDFLKEYNKIDFNNIDVEQSQDAVYTADFTIKGIPEDKINEAEEDELRKDFCDDWGSLINNIQLENWNGPICIVDFDIERVYNSKSKFGRTLKEIIDRLTKIEEADEYKPNGVIDDIKRNRVDNTNVESPLELNTGVLPVLDVGTYERFDSFWDSENVDDDKTDWGKVYEDIDEDIKTYGPSIVEEYIKQVLPSAKVKATGVYHPREYNFANDELEFTVSFNPEEFNKREEMALNDPEFKDFLKDKYKSYDGFFSYLADDIDDYKDQEGWKKFVQVVMFYLKDEDFEETNTSFWDDIYGNGSFYQDLVYKDEN